MLPLYSFILFSSHHTISRLVQQGLQPVPLSVFWRRPENFLCEHDYVTLQNIVTCSMYECIFIHQFYWLLPNFVVCRETASCLSKERTDGCTTGSSRPSSSCSKTWCRKDGNLPSCFERLDQTYLVCWELCTEHWMKGLIHCSLICLIWRWS